MSTYQEQLETGKTGNSGVGVQFKPAASDVFGHSGVGVVLGTNFLLVVLDQLGKPVDAGLPYTLTYFNPISNQTVVIPLLHNPAIPYQANLPTEQVITFALDAVNSGRYAAGQEFSIIIQANATGVLSVRLAYPSGTVYAHLIRKRLF